MKGILIKAILIILILFMGIGLGFYLSDGDAIIVDKTEELPKENIKFDDTQLAKWDSAFSVVEIKSVLDDHLQKAYFYRSRSKDARPLIVSLHTWSGNYSQRDDLAKICREKDLNYIHPDFRGENWTKNACCSELAMNDIDNAISFALENSNVDKDKIYVIGVSGGGYATLSTFMRSQHQIRKFSAWASISDLVAWYDESSIRNNKYAKNILDCTGSGDTLDIASAKARSPIYWPTPTEKLKRAELSIYTGIYDGIQGSVPINHSIHFYNKILKDSGVTDPSKFVSQSEHLDLLQHRKPLGDFGNIADRKIFLQKEAGNIGLTIFEGDHEMLTAYAIDALLQE